jgi:hypothetical protein
MSISTVSDAQTQVNSFASSNGGFSNPIVVKRDNGYLLVGRNSSNNLTDGSSVIVTKSDTDTYNACSILYGQ